MPPKIKVTEDEIMNVAISIVREKGLEKLNARELAKELGCSVHPIFRTFDSMEGMKSALYKRADDIYNQCMQSGGENEQDGFLGMGLAYIGFAKNEKNLFKLLFMSDVFREKSMLDIVGSTEGDDEIIELLRQRTGLSTKSSMELFAGIWLTTHGIASLYATNNCRFSDEENRRLLSNSFTGHLMKLKKEEEENK